MSKSKKQTKDATKKDAQKEDESAGIAAKEIVDISRNKLIGNDLAVCVPVQELNAVSVSANGNFGC